MANRGRYEDVRSKISLPLDSAEAAGCFDNRHFGLTCHEWKTLRPEILQNDRGLLGGRTREDIVGE